MKKRKLNVTVLSNNTKMINFDYIENIKKHNQNWPKIPDYPYRIVITGGSGFGKTCII